MHTLIIGRTRYGKTTLAKAIVRQAERHKREAIILDPLRSKWGNSSKYVLSVEQLLAEAKKTTNKMLVVDESAISLDRFDSTQAWLSKTSRHLGHTSIFIGQNITDIAKGIRTQCDQLFVFHCTRREAKDIDDEYDEPLLLKCTKLRKFCFAWINSSKLQWGCVNPNDFQISQISLENAVDLGQGDD